MSSSTRRPQLAGREARTIVRRYGCYCGCGQPTEGKALFYNAACRKRRQRSREAQENHHATQLETELFDARYYTDAKD